MKRIFTVGETINAKENAKLPGNTVAPPLIIGKDYTVKDITYDKEGNQHLDVGLTSDYEFIRSYETKEELPNGNKIHWCHPSRFN